VRDIEASPVRGAFCFSWLMVRKNLNKTSRFPIDRMRA
jgi:hypothetical protein